MGIRGPEVDRGLTKFVELAVAFLIEHKLFIAVKQSIVGWTTSVEPNVESKKEAGHEIQSRLAW